MGAPARPAAPLHEVTMPLPARIVLHDAADLSSEPSVACHSGRVPPPQADALCVLNQVPHAEQVRGALVIHHAH